MVVLLSSLKIRSLSFYVSFFASSARVIELHQLSTRRMLTRSCTDFYGFVHPPLTMAEIAPGWAKNLIDSSTTLAVPVEKSELAKLAGTETAATPSPTPAIPGALSADVGD